MNEICVYCECEVHDMDNTVRRGGALLHEDCAERLHEEMYGGEEPQQDEYDYANDDMGDW